MGIELNEDFFTNETIDDKKSLFVCSMGCWLDDMLWRKDSLN